MTASRGLAYRRLHCLRERLGRQDHNVICAFGGLAADCAIRSNDYGTWRAPYPICLLYFTILLIKSYGMG